MLKGCAHLPTAATTTKEEEKGLSLCDGNDNIDPASGLDQFELRSIICPHEPDRLPTHPRGVCDKMEATLFRAS